MSLYTQLSCDKTYIVCKGVHTIYVESPDLATYQSPYTHASYDYHVRQDKYSKVRENEKKILKKISLFFISLCGIVFVADGFGIGALVS